jgi:TPR repeat protein
MRGGDGATPRRSNLRIFSPAYSLRSWRAYSAAQSQPFRQRNLNVRGSLGALRFAILSSVARLAGGRKLKAGAAFIAVIFVSCAAVVGPNADAHAAPRSVAATIARAEHGDPAAAARLGWLFSTGRGVAQNYAEAAKWFYRAATHGNADAQFALGMAYNKGQGVPRDYVLSYLWLDLSAAHAVGSDHDFRATIRDAIASKMTPQQLLTAQQLALKWQKSR